MKRNFLIFIVVLFSLQLSTKAQKYSFKETPKWIKAIEIPQESKVSKYDIVSGYYAKLADYQVNLIEEAMFTREVYDVVSYSGITNASQISVVYDTNYQELKIHHLYIWRKGKKIDRTNELSFEIINNEFNLQQGIYSGQITAYDILNDIRKDDLIDFAYTLQGFNPIFDKERYVFMPMEMINPIDFFSFRILLPQESNYKYECVDCDSLIRLDTIVGDAKILEYSQRNVKPMEYEDYMLSWDIPYKYFTLSSLQSWKSVNKWAQKVFALEKEPNLDIVFEEIFDGEETTDDKINKIIDYCQDEIRYMGIESGIGSIKPFHPEQVVEQRFGDCKDKSLLLVSLLKKIGIADAYPALVNVGMKTYTETLLPSNQVFNHCIVRFDHNDTTYWVDPSIAQQGGDYRNICNTDYGKALIIGMPADTLHDMSPKQIESGIELIEVLTVKSFDEPAELKAYSRRYGLDADSRRVVLDYISLKDLNESILKEMSLVFPVIEGLKAPEISDDMENNYFDMSYLYKVDEFWIDGDKSGNEDTKGYWFFKYEPLVLYQYFSKTSCAERKFDFTLNYPLNLKYSITFNFPKEMLIYDDIVVFDNDAFYYEEKYEQLSSTSMKVEYTYKSKTDCLKAEKYKEVCEQINEIAKDLSILIYFNK